MVSLVRPAEVEDAAAIAAVHVATWRTTYRGLLPDDFLDSLDESGYEERCRRILVEPSSRVYVAADGPQVVGFASGGRERAGAGPLQLHAVSTQLLRMPRTDGRYLAVVVVVPPRAGHRVGDRLAQLVRRGRGESVEDGEAALAPGAVGIWHDGVVQPLVLVV